jgi:hypothetical protein
MVVDRGALSGLMPVRRFPPPWTIDEAATPVSSSATPNGQALAYYCEDDPGRP